MTCFATVCQEQGKATQKPIYFFEIIHFTRCTINSVNAIPRYTLEVNIAENRVDRLILHHYISNLILVDFSDESRTGYTQRLCRLGSIFVAMLKYFPDISFLDLFQG